MPFVINEIINAVDPVKIYEYINFNKDIIMCYYDEVRRFNKYKMILCREEESIGYLKSLGLKNVLFFPDPAFQIRGELEAESKKYIGVNLSPLSLIELYGNINEDQSIKLATILDKLYKKTGIELMFIPHVLSPDTKR